jgi:hypothetical protein
MKKERLLGGVLHYLKEDEDRWIPYSKMELTKMLLNERSLRERKDELITFIQERPDWRFF